MSRQKKGVASEATVPALREEEADDTLDSTTDLFTMKKTLMEDQRKRVIDDDKCRCNGTADAQKKETIW